MDHKIFNDIFGIAKAGLKFQHNFMQGGEEYALYQITLTDFLSINNMSIRSQITTKIPKNCLQLLRF